MNALFVLLLLPLLSPLLTANGKRFRLPTDSRAYLTQQVNWFDQTLDHFSPTDHRQFKQRYYEFLDYYDVSNGPIFLKICGESTCPGIVNDYTSVLAEKFGAALVSLEHRYYGMSSPFKLTITENLRYLSSKQALFDLAVFRQYYQVKDDVDFLYLLADAAAIAFQYGNPDVLCSPLLEAKKSKQNLVLEREFEYIQIQPELNSLYPEIFIQSHKIQDAAKKRKSKGCPRTAIKELQRKLNNCKKGLLPWSFGNQWSAKMEEKHSLKRRRKTLSTKKPQPMHASHLSFIKTEQDEGYRLPISSTSSHPLAACPLYEIPNPSAYPKSTTHTPSPLPPAAAYSISNLIEASFASIPHGQILLLASYDTFLLPNPSSTLSNRRRPSRSTNPNPTSRFFDPQRSFVPNLFLLQSRASPSCKTRKMPVLDLAPFSMRCDKI
ncbi:putative serine protease EDA2 [Dendrobium catenatum]|uniref:Putative serine protease EDA2 n=1 Tax=Dendrobium catenatum TaxID=906689 RepID=A0A2I0XAJ8_9ASPA|nr:putative serine protease EDA2 [Dendrobium catenatum]